MSYKKEATMMTYGFKTEVILVMMHEEGSKKSKHVETKITLEISEGLNKDAYMTEDGGITKEGISAIGNTLTQGLIHCIMSAENMGYHKRQEFKDFIVKELERGLA